MNYNDALKIKGIVKQALKEDIGRHDLTTESVIPEDKFIKAVLLTKEDCVVCGLDIACLAFKLKNNKIKFKALVEEGQAVRKGKILAQIQGRARPILSAERVALNFLCLLSGISTKTRSFVKAIRPLKVKILDTRKTIPGLRVLEKYAVRAGGGFNHRMRLDELILAKDNHFKVIGDTLWVIGFKGIKNKISSKIKIEVEIKTLNEFKKALKLRPDIIMLDNMSIQNMKKAVAIRNKSKIKLEASGGITLKNVKKIASIGVDAISVGALTHSVNSVDISLEVI